MKERSITGCLKHRVSNDVIIICINYKESKEGVANEKITFKNGAEKWKLMKGVLHQVLVER